MAVLFALTVFGGLGLLGLAVWPGVLEDTVYGVGFCCLPVSLLGCWFFLLVVLAIRDLLRKPRLTGARRWGLWSAIVMFATMGLLWLHVPQRLAFAVCYAEMQEAASAAPLTIPQEEGYHGRELGRRFGPYPVDRWALDRRGGVYFRTHTGPDGIGPDEMSYGFAFQPNDKGTPFGTASYRCHHLFGEWYVFAASNDW